jgi:hypothetical protein
MKSKVERSYWKNVALSAVPDLLIACAAMRLTDGGAEVFFWGAHCAASRVFSVMDKTKRVGLASVLAHQSFDDEQPH